MKILFLHPNFPAQFKESCKELGELNNADVKFLCQTHYGREVKGVKKLVIKGRGSHEYINENYKKEIDKTNQRLDAYANALDQLKKMGWNPDIVISHNGWGCGIYVKEVWPECKMISYSEWWFDPESDFTKRMIENEYISLSKSSMFNMWKRNIYPAMEMATADLIISPSKWQKKQLPAIFREKCLAVQDKIDKNTFFHDPSARSKIPLLTYGTRGMEPIRGFPEFVEILPQLLKKWPTLHVEIAGDDEINYAGSMPKEGSWGRWAKKRLENTDNTRIKWVGRLPLKKYTEWLRKTWCHVYITEPFVTSWSFLEAIESGARIVASDHEAIREFSKNSDDVVLVNHYSQYNLIEAINSCLRKPPAVSRRKETNANRDQSYSDLTRLILQMGKRTQSIDRIGIDC